MNTKEREMAGVLLLGIGTGVGAASHEWSSMNPSVFTIEQLAAQTPEGIQSAYRGMNTALLFIMFTGLITAGSIYWIWGKQGKIPAATTFVATVGTGMMLWLYYDRLLKENGTAAAGFHSVDQYPSVEV